MWYGHTYSLLLDSSMRLFASERTCRFLRLSKFSMVRMRLFARLKSRRLTNFSSPDIASMLLKERSSHSRWMSVSRPVISSIMLLSSWRCLRFVNCHKFSIHRISIVHMQCMCGMWLLCSIIALKVSIYSSTNFESLAWGAGLLQNQFLPLWQAFQPLLLAPAQSHIAATEPGWSH